MALAAALPPAAGAQGSAAWPPLPGDRPLERSAESQDLRSRTWDQLLGAPRALAMAFQPRIEENAWGRWRVFVDQSGAGARDAFYSVFAPERGGTYPLYAQGTWIVKRSRTDGSFLQAKVFLRSDPQTFARIYPFGGRSLVDVVAYGGVLYREVIVPLSFETILRSPFSRVRELTSDVIDWSLFSPEPALYAGSRSLAASVRSWLPRLRYADDGAIDADGIPVFIASLKPQGDAAGLNCSGFAKWLVDGTIAPFTGSYLRVEDLKRRMLDWRGTSLTAVFEESRDPFFGLDWARALARSAWSALYTARPADSPLANDVDDPPFSLIVSSADPINGGSSYRTYADNFKDIGFELAGLRAVLFTLAMREPGRYYLAQFNARSVKEPALQTWFHLAALFPYFDEDGIFRVAVFESAAETSLERIMGDPDYEFVQLVRMPVSGSFSPQQLPPASLPAPAAPSAGP